MSGAPRVVLVGLLAVMAGSLFLFFRSKPGESLASGPPLENPGEASSSQGVRAPSKAEQGNRRKEAKDPGYWGAEAGSLFRYQVRLEFAFGFLEAGKQEPKEWAPLLFQGDLQWLVHRRSEGEILSSLQFSHCSFLAMGKEVEDAHRTKAARSKTFVRMNEQGKILGLAFARDLGVEQRDFLRSIFTYLSFPLPAQGLQSVRTPWEAEGGDATGKYLARFRVLSQGQGRVQLERVLLQYQKMAQGIGDPPRHKVTGRVLGVLDQKELHWLREVRVHETLRMKMPGGEGGTVLRSKGSIRWTSKDRVPLDALVSLGALGPERWSSPGGDGESGEMSSQERRDMLAEVFKGVSLQQLLDQLRSALAKHGFRSRQVYEAWSQLGQYLELHPQDAFALRDRILGGEAQGDLARLLAVALGAAGTEEAQAVLRDLGNNGNLPEELREEALRSMIQLARPSRDTLEMLREQVLKGSLERGKLGPMETASLLSFGALAGRSEDKLKDGGTALSHLLRLESKARRGGFLSTWIAALGNSGRPEVLAVLERFSQASHPSQRESAIHALATLGTENAAKVLLQQSQREKDPGLKVQIVRSLSRMDRPVVMAKLREWGRRSSDPRIRAEALQGLARHLDQRENFLALQEASRNDPDPKVRAFAQEILKNRRR